jgi:predicted nucleic acid-binding protein
MKHSVLLDTSFFVRLLNDEDPLHTNAKDYFRYFLEHDVILKVSTISIAEYCVRGKIDELPLRNLQILPFNLDQAIVTGAFANAIFTENKISTDKLDPRAIIPNDSKLFAQAETDKSIYHFVTSDKRSNKTFSSLKKTITPNFSIIDISIPFDETFGVLKL